MRFSSPNPALTLSRNSGKLCGSGGHHPTRPALDDLKPKGSDCTDFSLPRRFARWYRPRRLAQWWAADVQDAGGAIDLGFFNRTTVYSLRPTVQSPPGAFECLCETGEQWSGTRLFFPLEPAGSGTLVRFTTQAGLPRQTVSSLARRFGGN